MPAYIQQRTVSTFEIRQLIEHGHINIHSGAFKLTPSVIKLQLRDLLQHSLLCKGSTKFPHDKTTSSSSVQVGVPKHKSS